MLTVITPTGGRQSSFERLARCIESQTCRDFEWIIVDDVDPPTSVPMVHDKIGKVDPLPRWQPGQNTLARNILAGIMYASGDAVAIMEDDDWYRDDWIAQCIDWMEDHELAGEGNSHYYNLANGTGKEMMNTKHASLCATVCRGSALKRLGEVCEKQDTLIDVALWRTHPGHLEPWAGRVVGLKGQPGRPGIGVGHQLVGTKMPITDWIPDWQE